LQGAEEAILYINDGGTQQALHLDPKLLRGGALSFVPSSDDVELRFEVDRGGKPAAEDRVHLLLPNVPVEVPLHEAAQNSKKTQAVLDLKKAVAAAAKPGPSDRAQRGQPNETPAPATPRPVQFVAPARSIHPSISDVQFDQPPSIPIEAKYSDLIVTAPVVRPEAPIAQNDAAIVPVKPAAPTKVVPSQPTRVTSFVGPHVIRQVNPSIPMELRARITPDTQIEVALTIDTSGNVTNAKIASMKGAATGFISAEVLRAARLFQFRPAQENNRNIESQMVLTFRFGPVGK
jgi:TonB family protein